MTFLSTFLILLIEGAAIAALLLPSGSWLLPFLLSLPLAAFTNVLLVFAFTVAGIPLIAPTLLGGHLMLLGATVTLIMKRPALVLDQHHPERAVLAKGQKALMICAVLLLAANAVYSFSHAVMLPSNQYDSATNWTMRSEISFYDHTIAFDADEERGMAKPQYPFLYHALQITANQSLIRWSDTAANTILFALSLCTFGALYSMIKRLRGPLHSLLTITTLVGLPILGLHLAQGYGDLNLVQYLLLSLVSLGVWIESDDLRRNRWLVLSGIFAAASVWTKSEGLLFGLGSWIVTVAAICGMKSAMWKSASRGMITTIALSIPWPMFAVAKGLSLTPHNSDTMIGFRSEGLTEAVAGLFSRGSFGIHWYALLLLVPAISLFGLAGDPRIEKRARPLLVFAGLTFAGFLFVYLFTPNVRFLLNAESYYRQMMLPAALFALSCSLSLKKVA